MKQSFRIFFVFLLACVFPCASFAQDALEKLIEQREAFGKMCRERGMSFRFEQYVRFDQGPTQVSVYECKWLDGYGLERSLGRDIDDPFDDTIYVGGPSYNFMLRVVKGDSGGEAYQLMDICPEGAELPEQSLLREVTDGGEGTYRAPWQFYGRDLEYFRDQYEVFKVSQPNSEEVWVEFSEPKDVASMIRRYSFVDLKGKLIFRADHGWQLSRAEWSRENYNSDGKKTESFTATRDYFSRDGEFGHGVFENGKFVDGVDELSHGSSVSFARRVIWKPVDIDPAIFTPKYYGIDPSIGVAKQTNWFLWIGVAASVLAIVSGVWLRRRALRDV